MRHHSATREANASDPLPIWFFLPFLTAPGCLWPRPGRRQRPQKRLPPAERARNVSDPLSRRSDMCLIPSRVNFSGRTHCGNVSDLWPRGSDMCPPPSRGGLTYTQTVLLLAARRAAHPPRDPCQVATASPQPSINQRRVRPARDLTVAWLKQAPCARSTVPRLRAHSDLPPGCNLEQLHGVTARWPRSDRAWRVSAKRRTLIFCQPH